MKIMTFNTQHCLNYVERKIDFQIMADAIVSCKADIVALNEMRGNGVHPEYTDQVKILSEKTGLNYYHFAKAIDVKGENPYGNGILSRIPIIKFENIPIPDPTVKSYHDYYESRCILKATLENGLTVLVTHFGLNPDEQENAVKTVLEHLEDQKCILMGDFNMVPDNKILMPIRQRLKDAADVFSSPLYSFPSDLPNIKIDYIFVSCDIEVVDADVPPIVASDHRPHTATINFIEE